MTDAAVTAKAIRKELKAIFPSTKFRVRSSNFAGGDAVDIYWTDGPSYEMVERLVKKYETSTFDPYTDCQGFDRSNCPADVPGASFVMCNHSTSEEFEKAAEDFYKNVFHVEADYHRYENYYYDHLEAWATADVIAEKARQNAEDEAERARQQAEDEAERARQQTEQEAEDEKAQEEGRPVIEKAMKDYPIKSGENYVLVHWSENPAFYAWGENTLKLSVKAADVVFSFFDKKVHEANEGGYDKTKYSIVSPSGEVLFTDRYDLGDMLGGLVAVLRQYGRENLLPASMQETAKPAKTDARKAVSDFLANLKKDSKKSLEKVPADPDRVPVIEADVSRLPPDLLSVLASGIAARQLLANPLGPGVTEEIKKTPQYKRAHISVVLSKAFRAKS